MSRWWEPESCLKELQLPVTQSPSPGKSQARGTLPTRVHFACPRPPRRGRARVFPVVLCAAVHRGLGCTGESVFQLRVERRTSNSSPIRSEPQLATPGRPCHLARGRKSPCSPFAPSLPSCSHLFLPGPTCTSLGPAEQRRWAVGGAGERGGGAGGCPPLRVAAVPSPSQQLPVRAGGRGECDGGPSPLSDPAQSSLP